MKVAINGFGRIGRSSFKILFEKMLEGYPIEIVGINDLASTKVLAYLLSRDSIYGRYHHNVSFDDEHLIINSTKIKVTSIKNPAELPWQELGVDSVLECTGLFVDPELAKSHLIAGSKKVIVSAPFKNDNGSVDIDGKTIKTKTLVIGVNDSEYTDESIVSNGSCTTNCVTPLLYVLNNEFGILKSMMSTIHSFTASQVLHDSPAKEMRESRAATLNLIPTTTGAAKAVSLAIPEMKDKFVGLSIRIPTPVVSIVDLTAVLAKKVDIQSLDRAFGEASKSSRFEKLITIAEEDTTSTDIIGNSASAIVDLGLTQVVDGDLIKIVAWYDNEWGYSNRLVELCEFIG